MSYDGELPELTEFPEGEGLLPGLGVSLPGVMVEGFGLLAAQNAEDYREIFVQTALGSTPRNGFICVVLDAEGARALANHLLHLAQYAELGLEAEAPSE